MANAPKKSPTEKTVEEPASVGPAPEPDTFGDSDGTGLTDRQRTRLEKRDSAVADLEAAPSDDCDNHPGVASVVQLDGGGLHSPQKFCEECQRRRGEG